MGVARETERGGGGEGGEGEEREDKVTWKKDGIRKWRKQISRKISQEIEQRKKFQGKTDCEWGSEHINKRKKWTRHN